MSDNERFSPSPRDILQNQFNPDYFIALAKRFRDSNQNIQALTAAQRVLQISPDNSEGRALVQELESLAATNPNMVWETLPQPVTSPGPPPQQAPQTSPLPPSLPPQSFSDSGPTRGMALKLKRSERLSTFGTRLFVLDARMEISAENRALIEKYKLGNRLIYESANREKYRDKALRNVANTSDQPGLFASPGAQVWGLAKTLGRVAAAGVNATVAALSLRITVNSLIAGVHVECKDMNELLEAEDAITGAGLNLKAELEAASTFTGKEQIIDL